MTTSGRLLTLLSLLQARRDWTAEELADRLEVSTRTIRRDVERLRGLGYPVDATTGPAGGYRLHAGTAMPPLLLEDDEAVAIAVGLRAAAGTSVAGIEETSVRALVKLEQVLPSHLRRQVNALQSATATLPATGPRVDPEALTLIAAAMRDHERVRFRYSAGDGTESRRDVEPHGLVNLGRRWYLVAWCTQRLDWRTFRLDRVERPAPSGARFAERRIPGGDAAAFVTRHRSDALARHQAHVTLHAPAAEVERRHPHLHGQLEPDGDERCTYRSSDASLDWLAIRIGMLEVPFEVHGPPELRERLATLAERFARGAAGYTSSRSRSTNVASMPNASATISPT